ncbi:unnamed protein product [Dracunculus medinensis]|uniref:BACK domain-containing protein n=1 Tax=Dracunculus medinensis TaxID=318479 RepID=A0A0N4U2Q7_DRAME|nr:unnamed protein product [Dracunculus medinensis]
MEKGLGNVVENSPRKSGFRILRLGDAKVRVSESRFIPMSSYIKRRLTQEKGLFATQIFLDDLAKLNFHFSYIGLTIAKEYSDGQSVFDVKNLIDALAVANALEMEEMLEALTEQLLILASNVDSVLLAIDIAALNLRNKYCEKVIQSLERGDSKSETALTILRAILMWLKDKKHEKEKMYRIINEILPYSDENLCNHLKLIFDANITNMIDSQRICETHSASESIYFHEYQKMQEVLSSAKLETVDQPVKKLETEQTENIHNMDDNSLVKQKSEKSKKEEEVKDATENNLDAQSFPEFVLNALQIPIPLQIPIIDEYGVYNYKIEIELERKESQISKAQKTN